MGGLEALKKILSPDATPERDQKSSAVLIPLAQTNGDYISILTKRTLAVTTHKGQISFPGGGYFEGDFTLSRTALREAEEEIGLDPKIVEPLGFLKPVFTRFQMLIYPLVGIVKQWPVSLVPNPREVDRILLFSIRTLLEKPLPIESVQISGVTIKSQVFYVEKEQVWGATAQILSLLREALLRNTLFR